MEAQFRARTARFSPAAAASDDREDINDMDGAPRMTRIDQIKAILPSSGRRIRIIRMDGLSSTVIFAGISGLSQNHFDIRTDKQTLQKGSNAQNLSYLKQERLGPELRGVKSNGHAKRRSGLSGERLTVSESQFPRLFDVFVQIV
jgi:hypothetical protein